MIDRYSVAFVVVAIILLFYYYKIIEIQEVFLNFVLPVILDLSSYGSKRWRISENNLCGSASSGLKNKILKIFIVLLIHNC